MDCQKTRTLIHGYVDEELDLVTSLEIERHLQECAGCEHAVSELHDLRSVIRAGAPYFQAPPALAARIRSSPGEASHAVRPARPRAWRWLAVAASLLLTLATGWGLAHALRIRPEDATLAQELSASHVRSQMLPTHRFDVASTDPHTVKPWFEGKLDFSPPVKDLADRGFPLIGGRLDYVRNRPVAALVYQRRKHTINVFIWPTSPDDHAAPGQANVNGFHMLRFHGSGMTFWAVSDLNEAELREFVGLLQG